MNLNNKSASGAFQSYTELCTNKQFSLSLIESGWVPHTGMFSILALGSCYLIVLGEDGKPKQTKKLYKLDGDLWVDTKTGEPINKKVIAFKQKRKLPSYERPKTLKEILDYKCFDESLIEAGWLPDADSVAPSEETVCEIIIRDDEDRVLQVEGTYIRPEKLGYWIRVENCESMYNYVVAFRPRYVDTEMTVDINLNVALSL